MFGFKKTIHKGNRNEEMPAPNEGLPDSNQPAGLCPRCGKQSSFENLGSLPVTFDGGVSRDPYGNEKPITSDRVTSLRCRHCGQGTVVIEEEWIGEMPKKYGHGGYVSYHGIHWWPLPSSSLSKDIPEDIAGAYHEANTALLANCPRAATVMARRTLEAIAKEQGEEKGTLADMLTAMVTKGALHPTLSQWAKEIRLIGNAGAHFDPINQVNKSDAEQLLRFLQELMKYIYEMPAELERMRTKA